MPYRFASIVDNSGIDDKIVGVTKAVSNNINTNTNLRQPKELVLKFTSIAAVTGTATNTNITIKKSNLNRSLSSLDVPLYQYTLKFQTNNR